MHSDSTARRITACIAMAAAALGCTNQQATAAEVTAKKVEKMFVSQQAIPVSGDLVSALLVSDKTGQHLLVLAQLTGPSKANARAVRKERTDLNASYYSKSQNRWVREWVIQDFVDCPDLDHTAAFFPENVTVTDLDENGTAEVTVPYKLFCGGGVDSSTLKVIMRQGAQKFAMRGTTRIETPGNDSFGGDANYDKTLAKPENAAFKKHIATVRDKVVAEKY